MNVIKDRFNIISMSVAKSLYKSMLKTTGIKNVRGIKNINNSEVYYHHYVYENEIHKVIGPYEDRVKNLMYYVKFRINYGRPEDIDDLFKIHKLMQDFINMSENENLGEYEYETEIEILDNY